MAKKIFILLPIFVCVIICLACQGKPVKYLTVSYLSSEGGVIEGNAEQIIIKGENATSVTAIPNEGYKFIKWSDNILTAERTDENITDNLTVTAIFVKMARTYKYIYNNATENISAESIYIDYKNINNVTLVVPQRMNSIFEGWYLEKDFKTQVTDATGNIVIDTDIFNSDSDKLYAKYSLIKDASYKILMVYVPEVEGTFELETYATSSDGSVEIIPNGNRYIHYKMSDVEIQLCKQLTKKFEEILNDIFAGLVNFEIKEYFTENIINEESFISGSSSALACGYSLYANHIPELTSDVLDNFDSVLTTVQLGDFKDEDKSIQLHNGAGGAYEKYGCIYWDKALYTAIIKDIALESLPDEDYFYEGQIFYEITMTYLHEFMHTIEMSADFGFNFHDVLVCYSEKVYHVSEYEVSKLIFFNQADFYGKKVGIPYDFWLDELYFNVNFVAGVGGKIDGNLNQRIKLRRDAETVTAIPDFGYKFKEWHFNGSAIGKTDAVLQARDIRGNTQYFAIFEEITKGITYVGIIDNSIDPDYFTDGTVYLKDFLQTGLWVPQKDGYKFEGWYFDINFTSPFGDQNGNVTEEDYKIFDNEQFGRSIILYGKFSKTE